MTKFSGTVVSVEDGVIVIHADVDIEEGDYYFTVNRELGCVEYVAEPAPSDDRGDVQEFILSLATDMGMKQSVTVKDCTTLGGNVVFSVDNTKMRPVFISRLQNHMTVRREA
jgi:hypothetical protein